MIEYFCSPNSLFLGLDLSHLGFGCSYVVVIFFSIVGTLISGLIWERLERPGWSKPKIKLIAHKHLDYVRGNSTARLEIKNLEESEITGCYATLEQAHDIFFDGEWKGKLLIPNSINKPSRVVWDETEESYGRCEIDIPLKNSCHINIMDMAGGIHYNLCGDKKIEPSYVFRTVVCTFRIRIDGKFNGKGMKPQFFDGYVRFGYKPFHFTSSDIENEHDVIEGNRYVPYMIFGSGDWTKDEEIRKDIERERIEGMLLAG